MHRRLVYIYLLNVPSFSSRHFNKIKRTSRLGRFLALLLEILLRAQTMAIICTWRNYFDMIRKPSPIDVPRPLINDLCVVLFDTIDAEC